MDADCIIPACVDACKENVLKLISVDDLAELNDRLEFSDILEEAMKFLQEKLVDGSGTIVDEESLEEKPWLSMEGVDKHPDIPV